MKRRAKVASRANTITPDVAASSRCVTSSGVESAHGVNAAAAAAAAVIVASSVAAPDIDDNDDDGDKDDDDDDDDGAGPGGRNSAEATHCATHSTALSTVGPTLTPMGLSTTTHPGPVATTARPAQSAACAAGKRFGWTCTRQ